MSFPPWQSGEAIESTNGSWWWIPDEGRSYSDMMKNFNGDKEWIKLKRT